MYVMPKDLMEYLPGMAMTMAERVLLDLASLVVSQRGI
jgi:hypothetical protein